MKDYESIIKQLEIFHRKKLLINKLSGGLTNVNYFVDDGKEKFVARFGPSNPAQLGISKQLGAKNYKIAGKLGVGPELVKFYPKHNLLVVKYLEGKRASRASLKDMKVIRALADSFHKLNNGPRLETDIDLFVQTKNFFSTAKKLKSWQPANLDFYISSVDKLEKLLKNDKSIKPSHLDLMFENVIHVKNGIKLIDWEYAGNADLRFDPAMISFKAKFTKREDVQLLDSYKDYSLRELELMKALVALREAGWGLVQMKTSTIKFDYKKHVVNHLSRFVKIAKAQKL